MQPSSGQQTPSGVNPGSTFSAQSSQAALRAALDDGVTVQELAPMDRGIRAWTFCFSAFVLEMMIWGFCFSYGIFQDYYTTHAPFNKASGVSIAAVGTVSIALQYCEVLWLCLIFDRYPEYLNIGMWGGLALSSVSIFCCSFATEVWQLILLQGVGFGIGGGLLYVPVIKLLSEWFSERRGLAGGIIFAGGGVGGFVFPFALTALLDKVGLQWTMRIWAIGSTVCSGIALLGMRPRLPVPKFTGNQRRPRFIPPHLGFMRNPIFWSVGFTTLLQGLSYFPVSLYIASFTRALSSPLTATIVLSVFNSSAVVGQIVLGHLSDKFPYPWIMFVSALGSGLVAFLLWGFATAATQLYLFAIIFGALSGGFSSTWPRAASDCARGKPEYAGLALASTAIFKGVSAVVGPALSGVLLEAGKGSSFGGVFGREGYGAVELFVGSCALATGAGSILVAHASRRARV
ncbi:MFS general substrate transporter [Trametes versicolor FP-101664 SS1]|uniref:MFS general substrate transporter n=1 Tax=Trametes versicolor (strain FP-101664) TaxID=717944 RepID=UPI00046239BE|nr:MFS general substrate transporter [Trametes versicolor FP-101664 SS1]EIW61883.1 MFS general substrate transporter [Trametes versicolor FP-101664 SS1]